MKKKAALDMSWSMILLLILGLIVLIFLLYLTAKGAAPGIGLLDKLNGN